MIYLLAVLIFCISSGWAKLEKAFVPNTYLIEFKHDAKPTILDRLGSLNITYRTRHEYVHMNAVSLSFNTSQDASQFFDHARSHVRRTWPVTSVARPNAKELEVGESKLTGLFEHYDVTGVFKVREELGLTGKGIKVGVIDTGIDYMHPALGGCFGSDCRVAYGYDFVGDNYNGENNPMPNPDPRDCNGHGTHVAGIIGANDTIFKFTGVAPEATLGAYRVFGCDGSSADDVIMKAMEMAFDDGMDVINLSLGDIGWPDSPTSVLADILSTKGMIVCAAAGNEGAKGVFEVGAPSLGRHVISVASTDNMQALAHTIKFADKSIGYSTASGKPFKASEAVVVPVSDTYLSENDACGPISMNVNLQGKIALVGRGGCFFSEKVLNVQAAGAIGAIVYNNEVGLITPSAGDPSIHIDVAGISKEHGELLYSQAKSNPETVYSFSNEDVSFPIDTAGTISTFSSWGLAPDLSIKPDVSAPGGQIYSTFPLDRGSYATLSGTSMASPHVAGIIALLQQARGGNRSIDIEEVRSSIIGTSLPFNVYTVDALDSVARQGTGMINVYRALRACTKVTPQQLQLGDIPHSAANNEYTFTVHNNGRMAADYTITHRAAVMAQGYMNNNIQGGGMAPLKKPDILYGSHAEAIIESITPDKLNIPINGATNVTVRIRPPENFENIPPSIYSGYFVVTKDNDPYDTLHVPYAGLTSTLSDLPVLYLNGSIPEVVVDGAVNALSPALIRIQLIHASPLVLVTAIDESDSIVGVIPGGYWSFVGRHDLSDNNDALMMTWNGDIATTPEQAMAVQGGSSSSTVDLTVNHPALFRAQHIDDDGSPANLEYHSEAIPLTGEPLRKGAYKLKVMALHPFGDYQNMADYDTWTSSVIHLV